MEKEVRAYLKALVPLHNSEHFRLIVFKMDIDQDKKPARLKKINGGTEAAQTYYRRGTAQLDIDVVLWKENDPEIGHDDAIPPIDTKSLEAAIMTASNLKLAYDANLDLFIKQKLLNVREVFNADKGQHQRRIRVRYDGPVGITLNNTSEFNVTEILPQMTTPIGGS